MKTDDELRDELHGPNVHHFPGAKKPTRPQSLHPQSMASLADKPVPVLKFMMPQWIPWGYPVLFCGRGSIGKTTLACQLAATTAIGGWFLGMELPKLKSLALLCEDNTDDTHRMLVRLAEQLGEDLSKFKDFDFDARMGEDNALVFCDRRGNVKPTPLYQELAQRIGDEKRDLLALDNIRHVIAGINENDNSAVTAAWSLLHGLMRPTKGTTLALGHVPKYGPAEYAGGAAWENVARSRLYLGPAAVDQDDELVADDPRRIFRRGKSNATGIAELKVVLEHGGFRLEHPEAATLGDKLAQEMHNREAMQAVVDAVDALTKRGINASHSKNAPNYAPKVIRQHALANGFTSKQLEAGLRIALEESRLMANQKVDITSGCRHQLRGLGPPPRCG